MPNLRLMLWGVLAAILFLIYQTWLHDYEPPVSAVTQQGTAPVAPPANTLGDTVPQATTAAAAPAQTANAPAAAAAPAPSPAGLNAASESESNISVPLHITTDVLDVGINLKGGELDRADLLDYPQRKDTPNIPVSRRPPATCCRAGSPAPPAKPPLRIWRCGSRMRKHLSSRRAPRSCACP
jgi:YidC/Oxa1 family membrane protein insertase